MQPTLHGCAEGGGSRYRGPAAEGARAGPRSRGPSLEPFVVTSLVQLLCRTTKLCWFDDDHFSRIVEDAKRLLEKGSQGGSHVRPGPVTKYTGDAPRCLLPAPAGKGLTGRLARAVRPGHCINPISYIPYPIPARAACKSSPVLTSVATRQAPAGEGLAGRLARAAWPRPRPRSLRAWMKQVSAATPVFRRAGRGCARCRWSSRM